MAQGKVSFPLSSIYGISLSLLTDFYELTMAQAYWKQNLHEHEAVFHVIFRKKPFYGGFTVAAGLEQVIDYVENFSFKQDDLDYLSSLKTQGKPIFEEKFLQFLENLSFNCSIHAVPEGTVVFPFEPLARVQGPLLQAQLLESALLNLLNFPTLIATKAARICIAAKNDEVMEFGLRRAQGIDGALTASRAAFIGGCGSTSNTLAGKLFGIPVKGTHAHSWVMVFDDELESFQKYAEACPDNCVFLVDTYDTLKGVENAIQVGKWLESIGKKMIGIRLDSGDLAYLSIEARKMLDQAGLDYAEIVASNELDENIIRDLKGQGAKIVIWGVGTNLVTSKDQPALDGVYKISCIKPPGKDWEYRLKLSEQMTKVSNPGILQVRRFFDEEENRADMLYDELLGASETPTLIDPFDPTKQKKMSKNSKYEDLLLPIFDKGKKIYASPTLNEIRKKTQKNLNQFHPGIKRFLHPHEYIVGMEKTLYEKKIELIRKIRNFA